MMRNQKGFSLTLVVATIAVVAVVGLVGYRVIGSNNAPNDTAAVVSPTPKSQTPTESVDTTIKDVDAVTVDDSTLSDIDAQLDY